MLKSTWTLVVAIKTDRVQEHPLFRTDDAAAARQPLLPKKAADALTDV